MQKRDAISKHPPLQSFRAEFERCFFVRSSSNRSSTLGSCDWPSQKSACFRISGSFLVRRNGDESWNAFISGTLGQSEHCLLSHFPVDAIIVDLLTTIAGKGLRIRGPCSSIAYIIFSPGVPGLSSLAPSQMISSCDHLSRRRDPPER